jgi:hypothetical protein
VLQDALFSPEKKKKIEKKRRRRGLTLTSKDVKKNKNKNQHKNEGDKGRKDQWRNSFNFGRVQEAILGQKEENTSGPTGID